MTDQDLEGLFDPQRAEPEAPARLQNDRAAGVAPERGLPEVNRPTSRWAMPGMVLGAILISGGFAYSISEAADAPERPLTGRGASAYATPPAAEATGSGMTPSGAPVEAETASGPKPIAPSATAAGTREQERLRRLEEARQRADDARQRYAERLRSPLLVTSGDGSAASAGATVRPGASLGDRDANGAFLAQAGGAGVDTERGRLLANQDRLVPQGTLVPGVLETAINSDLPGMLRAVVSADVYSFDQSSVLIPRGTRLIGQYRSGVAIGQTRAFVVWTRLITPAGFSMQIGSPGTDALGQAGVTGTVDEHFFKRFGAALLLSIVGSAGQAAANAADDGGSDITINAAGDASRVAEIALSNRVNIPPTIKVRQGTPIRIFVAKDLDFSGMPAARLAMSAAP